MNRVFPYPRDAPPRLIIRRAHGFHSADAALALVMLAAGPIDLEPPHERITGEAAV